MEKNLYEMNHYAVQQNLPQLYYNKQHCQKKGVLLAKNHIDQYNRREAQK